MFVIRHDIDLNEAAAVKADLLAAIETHGSRDFAVDLSAGAPNQVALQLGFAALKELEARQFALAAGPNLEAVIKRQTAASELE